MAAIVPGTFVLPDACPGHPDALQSAATGSCATHTGARSTTASLQGRPHSSAFVSCRELASTYRFCTSAQLMTRKKSAT